MKFLIIALCVFSCAYAGEEKDAQVLKSEFDSSPDGSYHFAYETSNGVNSEQHAVVKPSTINKDEVALDVQGSVSYVAPDGQTIQLSYSADETGYHPQGNHLPTPPAPEAIPPQIARALEYIKQHPYKEEKY